MYNDIIDFIRLIYKAADSEVISLHQPVFAGNEKKYLLDAIDSTFVSSVGMYVNRFEDMMADITGSKYAVAIVNGTSALHIALKLIGVKQGEEVIMQPLTFVATANAISYEKANPHFVDVDEDTLGMSPSALLKRLEDIAEMKGKVCYNNKSGKRIAACVPMHTFGLPSRIDEILEICNKYNIPVIEDAAESLGSYYKSEHTGTFGIMGAFSFNGNKTVTCGGGGAIVTNDENLAKLAKHITTTAKVGHKWDYIHDQIGFNYRMPNINAALACAQLEQLDGFLDNKRETAMAYKKFFSDNLEVRFIEETRSSKSNYWLNAIRFKEDDSKNRFLDFSNSNGVITRPIWRLMNKLPMYKNCPKGDLTISRNLEKTIVNIPSGVRL